MVRTRFAPSPTGYLHIGGVRTALFNWLFARQHGGQFLLRIDDTDQDRNVQESLQPILDGLRWLGIDWDEGPDVGGPHAPYFQSQGSARYRAAVEQLLQVGAAYYDYALPEEVQAERQAAERDKREFVYSRRWMAETEADRTRWESQGRSAVVRLKMPRQGRLTLRDRVRGDVEFEWAREQDHVVQRADGSCLYHLATVVDDHDYAISHVIRAEEHLSNTPRQAFIFQSLGYPLPEFAHIPFVAEPGSRTKLSKRKLDKYLKQKDFKTLFAMGQEVMSQMHVAPNPDTFNPVIVDFYRQIGFLPDAIVNYLLLLGWSLDDKTEEFTRDEMIAAFTLERVNKAPASFDPKKLMSFQERYMQRLPIKEKVAKTLPFLQRAGRVPVPPPCDVGPYLNRIVQAAGDRIKFSGGILALDEFFGEGPTEVSLPIQQIPLLRGYRDLIAAADPFDAAELERLMKSYLQQQGLILKDLVHAVRLALTGKSVGLGLFETIEILGRNVCLKRLDRVLKTADAAEKDPIVQTANLNHHVTRLEAGDPK